MSWAVAGLHRRDAGTLSAHWCRTYGCFLGLCLYKLFHFSFFLKAWGGQVKELTFCQSQQHWSAPTHHKTHTLMTCWAEPYRLGEVLQYDITTLNETKISLITSSAHLPVKCRAVLHQFSSLWSLFSHLLYLNSAWSQSITTVCPTGWKTHGQM